MDPAVSFYQTLSSVSFTLLGIWFAVMQFGHGGWRSDPGRHRSTLHIAVHFFLPGMLGLASLLSTTADGGVVWRLAFVVGGVVGVAEAVQFIRAPGGPTGFPERAMQAVDPLLYLALIGTAFVPAKSFVLTPLQVGGIANGVLFLIGLCYVWLAFAERASAPNAEAAES